MAHHHKSASEVAALNDELRQRDIGGSRYITSGVHAQGPEFLIRVIAEVAAYDKFDADTDPYGEHDFGCVTVEGKKVFWKIDAYDRELKYGSPDPADPSRTHRVLTIMFSQEY